MNIKMLGDFLGGLLPSLLLCGVIFCLCKGSGTGCCLLLCLLIIHTLFVRFEMPKESINETEKIVIVKASNANEISGFGTGSIIHYQMEVHENNMFVYYYYLPNGDIKRGSILFDFPIREIEGDEAYLEKYTIGEDMWHMSVNYTLFVPTGTLTDTLDINLQ